MADLFPSIATEMEAVHALGDRARRLRTLRDALWSRWPWRAVPTGALRRRVFAWYATRRLDA